MVPYLVRGPTTGGTHISPRGRKATGPATPGRRGRRTARTPAVARRLPAQPAHGDRAFGKRLAQARRRAGFTQVDLASALERDRSLISHLERGNTGKMAEVLRNVAHELGVSADYLLGLTDSPVCDVCELRELHASLREMLDRSGGRMDRLNDAITLLLGRMGQ